MSDNKNVIYLLIVAVPIIIGGAIGWGILSTQWKTETIKMSLQQGQNPLYAMCSMDPYNEICKSMVMSMSLSGQFKDSTAPQAVSPAKK